ncbi:MAG: 50S ribosomal protein L6 [Candidatus Diapherotrites archaeon]
MAKKINEKKIALPAGITAEVSGLVVKIKKGGTEAVKKFRARSVKIVMDGQAIIVRAADAKKKNASTTNTIAAHIRNMVHGLEHGFEYKLEVVYSHFPMTVTLKGSHLEISNVTGAKEPRKAAIVGQTKVEIKGKDITVRGFDKEAAGQTAANLEGATRVKGKDVRIFQDGIYIVQKPKTLIVKGK